MEEWTSRTEIENSKRVEAFVARCLSVTTICCEYLLYTCIAGLFFKFQFAEDVNQICSLDPQWLLCLVNVKVSGFKFWAQQCLTQYSWKTKQDKKHPHTHMHTQKHKTKNQPNKNTRTQNPASNKNLERSGGTLAAVSPFTPALSGFPSLLPDLLFLLVCWCHVALYMWTNASSPDLQSRVIQRFSLLAVDRSRSSLSMNK